MTTLKELIREDRNYKSARRALDNVKKNFISRDILDELFTLQASRGVSALRPNKILQSSLHVLLDTSTQEIATRSRATTIKMTALRSLLSLEQVIDPLRKYLLIRYRKKFKAHGISGVTNEKNAVEDIMRLFYKEKRELDYIVKICDLVIEDTDAAGWGLKRISDTLEQASKDK